MQIYMEMAPIRWNDRVAKLPITLRMLSNLTLSNCLWMDDIVTLLASLKNVSIYVFIRLFICLLSCVLFWNPRPEVMCPILSILTVLLERGRRLSRNSAAASALIILTSGFGPTWRLTDGNTDDSPKDRLDLYDGKELRFGFVVGVCARRLCPVPRLVNQDAKLAALLACLLTSQGNMIITHRVSRKLYSLAC